MLSLVVSIVAFGMNLALSASVSMPLRKAPKATATVQARSPTLSPIAAATWTLSAMAVTAPTPAEPCPTSIGQVQSEHDGDEHADDRPHDQRPDDNPGVDTQRDDDQDERTSNGHLCPVEDAPAHGAEDPLAEEQRQSDRHEHAREQEQGEGHAAQQGQTPNLSEDRPELSSCEVDVRFGKANCGTAGRSQLLTDTGRTVRLGG